MKLISKDDLVAIIKYHMKEITHSYFCKCLLSEIDEHLKVLEVKNIWKPTDEQLKALNDIITEFDCKYGAIDTETIDKVQDLYEELKKLKE